MANKTVSNLNELTTVSNSDVLLVETATETLKVTKGNLLKEVNEQLNAKSNASHTHDEYVTENELNSKGLATETFVTNKIAEASLSGGGVDLSGYATIDFVTQEINSIELTPGPKGDKGDTGPQGPQGPQGPKGDAGTTSSAWKGKIASFLGDSITQGINTTKTYHAYLKDFINFAACHNYGISGSTITNRERGICDRYNTIASDSDIIFVFAGTNDFHFNKPLGEWYTLNGTTRTLNKDKSTFRGALSTICDGLISKFPNKQIILMTPIHRDVFSGQLTEMQANEAGLYLENYVECIIEAGKIFSIPVIDLYRESGLYPANENSASLYFHSNDKLHPNATGHMKIAKVIQGKLNTLLPLDVEWGGESGGDDNETITHGNIITSTSSLNFTAGETSTFEVSLDKAPTETQIVNIVTNGCGVDKTSLTFAPSNYATKQTVTVSGDVAGNGIITLSSLNVSNVIINVQIATSSDSEGDGGNDVGGVFTMDDYTSIGGQYAIEADGMMVKATVGTWMGVHLTTLSNGTYELTLPDVKRQKGQIMWYMYHVDDDYMHVLCVGTGNGEQGKRYKLSRKSTAAVALDGFTFPYTPTVGEVLNIVVSGSEHRISCNGTLLATLDGCNTMGACNQTHDGVNYALFKQIEKIN